MFGKAHSDKLRSKGEELTVKPERIDHLTEQYETLDVE